MLGLKTPYKRLLIRLRVLFRLPTFDWSAIEFDPTPFFELLWPTSLALPNPLAIFKALYLTSIHM